MDISNRKQIFNIEQIKLIVEKIIKRHTVSGIDQLRYDPFIHRVDSEIDLIVNKVNSGNYKFSRYKEKLIVKNRNSNPRCISIPTHRDKITLKALSKVLKLYFPYIKQPLVHSVIWKLISEIKSGKYTYFIKLDISSFYDN